MALPLAAAVALGRGVPWGHVGREAFRRWRHTPLVGAVRLLLAELSAVAADGAQRPGIGNGRGSQGLLAAGRAARLRARACGTASGFLVAVSHGGGAA